MAFNQGILIASMLALTMSHSWVERLMVLNTDGTMIGTPGYPRGAVSRLDPNFNDFQMQHLLPSGLAPVIAPQDRICKSTQTVGNYTSTLPLLHAWPGAFIALQYQENGHVTLPNLTPQKKSSGMVYIYGTSSPPNEDSLTSIHGVWNTEGTGGDRRGRLLASRNFDDGQCYQINEGPLSKERQNKYPKPAKEPQGADLWCQNDIQLPLDIGQLYSLYWVWDWPSAPSNVLPDGKPEIYTTCIDIEIGTVPEGGQGRMNFLDGQDLNTAGVRDQLMG